jgi:hypothetical protein
MFNNSTELSDFAGTSKASVNETSRNVTANNLRVHFATSNDFSKNLTKSIPTIYNISSERFKD